MDSKLLGGFCWVSGKGLDDYEDVAKVTILMLDGRNITISLHKNHVQELDLNILWHQLLESETFYHERNHTSEVTHRNQMALLCPPLGIVEVING